MAEKGTVYDLNEMRTGIGYATSSTLNIPSDAGAHCMVASFTIGNNVAYALQILGDYDHQALYFRIGLGKTWKKLLTN